MRLSKSSKIIGGFTLVYVAIVWAIFANANALGPDNFTGLLYMAGLVLVIFVTWFAFTQM